MSRRFLLRAAAVSVSGGSRGHRPVWHGSSSPPFWTACKPLAATKPVALGTSRSFAAATAPNVAPSSRTDASADARRGSGTSSSGGSSLRDLWSARQFADGRFAGTSGVPVVKIPSAELFRRHVEDDHRYRMIRVFGDRMSVTPPSGRHVFLSCGVIEGIFLCINAGTLSPFIFETFMPYHLKYTGLIIGWWGGTYLGLNMASFGPLANHHWNVARTAVGVFLALLGATSLVLADGVGGYGPWPSYWVLVGGYTIMAGFDTLLHSRQMIPPWLLRWKLGLSGLIVASLLLGVLKGKYLERNARQLVLEADMSE